MHGFAGFIGVEQAGVLVFIPGDLPLAGLRFVFRCIASRRIPRAIVVQPDDTDRCIHGDNVTDGHQLLDEHAAVRAGQFDIGLVAGDIQQRRFVRDMLPFGDASFQYFAFDHRLGQFRQHDLDCVGRHVHPSSVIKRLFGGVEYARHQRQVVFVLGVRIRCGACQ